MASQGRRNGIDLVQDLKTRPYQFRFFQAIRLLRLAERAAGRGAQLPRGLRFRTPASLAFPASEILNFEARPPVPGAPAADGTEAAIQEMEVAFFGLTGPSGVLPQHYTELLMDRKHHFRDGAAHAFFDLFSHRALALYFDAWKKYQFYVDYEAGQRDGFTSHLLALLGTSRSAGPDVAGSGKGVPKEILAFFAGTLGRRPLPASSLAAVVGSYFGVGVELEQFVGQWMEVPGEEQTRLGGSEASLGVNTVLGARVWDQQTRIRLRLGPLDQAQFQALQPGRPAAAALRELAEHCLGLSLNCDVTLVLDRKAFRHPVLGGPGAPPRLGIDTWICTRPPERNPDDVCFKLL